LQWYSKYRPSSAWLSPRTLVRNATTLCPTVERTLLLVWIILISDISHAKHAFMFNFMQCRRYEFKIEQYFSMITYNLTSVKLATQILKWSKIEPGSTKGMLFYNPRTCIISTFLLYRVGRKYWRPFSLGNNFHTVQSILTKLISFVPYVIVIKPVKNKADILIESAQFGRLNISCQNWVAQNAPIPLQGHSLETCTASNQSSVVCLTCDSKLQMNVMLYRVLCGGNDVLVLFWCYIQVFIIYTKMVWIQ
jgi:hypothetical protein